MGHQINFYVTPDDIREIEQQVRDQFGAVLVASASQQPPPQLLETSIRLLKASEGVVPELDGALRANCLIVRPQDIHSLPFVYSKIGWWVTLPFGRKAVEFIGGTWLPKELWRGRLWYEDVNPEFARWARSILRHVKSNLVIAERRHQFSSYATARALKWKEETNGVFFG